MSNYSADQNMINSNLTGDMINSSVVMDPGAKYGNPHGDFYTVSTEGVGEYHENVSEQITFSSFEQLEQFSDQISQFVIDEKERLRKKGHIFDGDLCNNSCQHYAHGDCPFTGRHSHCPRYLNARGILQDYDQMD